MKKTKEELDSTTNSRIYKRLRKKYLSISKGLIYCEICGPNKGCNRRRKKIDKRSWKKYRKTQWKGGAI
jgi:hypothetical protein